MGARTGNYSRDMYRETRRYVANLLQMTTAAKKIPVVDADFNDFYMQQVTYTRRALDVAFGNGAPTDYGFKLIEHPVPASQINNFIVEGGNTSAEGAARFYLGGYPLLNEGDVGYANTDCGTPSNPGPATRIHHVCTNVGVSLIQDSAANFVNNALIGRTLQVFDSSGVTPLTPDFVIASNSGTQINITGPDLITNYVTPGTWVWYRITLTTPSSGDRTDWVWLDAYLNEIDAIEDPGLNHNLSGPPNTPVEAARRLQVTQRVFVNENGVGVHVPLTMITQDYDPRSTIITELLVADASDFDIAKHPILRIGSGRNEEILLVDSYQTIPSHKIILSQPLEWRHYENDVVHASYYDDADTNRHYVALLSRFDRPNTVDEITNSEITDTRENNWGSPAELRDARLHLGGTLDEAIEARIPFVTLGTGVGDSIGIFNVTEYANAKACFDAAIAILSSGGVIWVRPGTYVLPNTLTITNPNIHIIGQSLLAFIDGPDGAPIIDIQANRCSVERVTFRPGDEGEGVVITSGDRFVMDDVVNNGQDQAQYLFRVDIGAGNFIRIQNTKFTGGTKLITPPKKGPYVIVNGGGQIAFDGCQFQGVTDLEACMHLRQSAAHCLVTDCNFINGDYGVLLNHNSLPGVEDVFITQCAFGNMDQAGIWVTFGVSGGENYILDNLTTVNCSSGLKINGSTRVQVGTVQVQDALVSGVYVYGSPNAVSLSQIQVISASAGVTYGFRIAGSSVVEMYDCRTIGDSLGTGIKVEDSASLDVSTAEIINFSAGLDVESTSKCSFHLVKCSQTYSKGIWIRSENNYFLGCKVLSSNALTSDMAIHVVGNNNQLVDCEVQNFEGVANPVAFYIEGGYNTFTGCSVVNGVGSLPHKGFHVFGSYNQFNHCRAAGLRDIGMHFDSTGAGSHAVDGFEGNRIATNSGSSILVETDTLLRNVSCEAGFFAALRVTDTCTVENSWFYDDTPSTRLLSIEGGSFTMKTSKLECREVVQNAVEIGAVLNATFNDVDVRGYLAKGFYFSDTGGSILNCAISNTRIIGPNAPHTPAYAIEVEDSYDGMIISNCHLDGNARVQEPILMKGPNSNIEGCQIRDFTDNGVTIQANNNRVDGCSIWNCAFWGIKLGDSVTPYEGMAVSNCTIHDVVDGVFVEGTRCKVSDCEIHLVNNYAVRLDPTSGKCQVTGIKVHPEQGGIKPSAGIYVNSDYNQIDGCFFEDMNGPTKAVINILGDYNQVCTCKIYNCDNDGGVAVSGGLSCLISGNHIKDVNSEYIRLNGGSNNCDISGNLLEADVYTNQTAVSVIASEDVKVEGNRFFGFLPLAVPQAAVYFDNAQYIHIASNRVDSCQRGVSGTLSEGVLIATNTFTDSSIEAILLISCGRPSVKANNIKGGIRGIKLETCDHALVGDNHIKYCSGYAIETVGVLEPSFCSNYTLECPVGSVTQWAVGISALSSGMCNGNVVLQTGSSIGDILFPGPGNRSGFRPRDATSGFEDIANHNIANPTP